jgi:peptide deformylase
MIPLIKTYIKSLNLQIAAANRFQMIYPIVAYGDLVLRKVARPIEKGEMDIKKLADDMFETMYGASGVGLAAPQIGLSIRFFVVDGTPLNDAEEAPEDYDPALEDFKKVFINAEILDETGEEWGYEEGCLSIPNVRGEVFRPETVTIRYRDLDWNEHTETYSGIAARIIQHEYDHIDGVLFTDHLPLLKRQLLKKKLNNITKGAIKVDYRMRFPK